MKTFLATIFLTSLLLGAAGAQEPAPAPGATASPVPKLELKRKSTFSADDARDPFWPIGWKKPVAQGSSAAGPQLSPEAFSLTSVVTGSGTHFAILNGKIIEEGQQFGLQFGNQVYQITLRAIEDGQVILAYQDAEITVPLKRH